MAGVLNGVRVIDLGIVISGPYTGSLLADLGADVIKVESPKGDQFRSYEAGFNSLNLGKRSICIDLRSSSGKTAFLNLIDTADIVLENFRPGVMDRFSLGWDVLHERNPRVVYCSISGFGSSGPYRDRPAYDTAIQSLSGFLSLLVDPAAPTVPGPPIADGAAGLYACYGILGALFERERTGIGRRVEVNMVESLIAFGNQAFGHYFFTDEVPGPTTRASVAQSYAILCKDGKSIGIHLSTVERTWSGLTAALEKPSLVADSRFKTYDGRVRNYDLLAQELGTAFATRSRDDWLPRLEANDVPCAPVNRIDEVVDDPQLSHLGTFREIVGLSGTPTMTVQTPVTYDGERTSGTTSPPALGEHTEEILRECGPNDTTLVSVRGLYESDESVIRRPLLKS